MFPLTMTPSESQTFLDLYMIDLEGEVSALYNSQRVTTANTTI